MKKFVQNLLLVRAGALVASFLREASVRFVPANLLAPRLRKLKERTALHPSTDGRFIDDPELLFKISPNYDIAVGRPWRLTVKDFDEAPRAFHEAQVEMVVRYLTSRWEVYRESIKARQQLPGSPVIDRLKRSVAEHWNSGKNTCVDLTTALKEEARQGKNLYFPIDGHRNRAAHWIVADAVEDFARDTGRAG